MQIIFLLPIVRKGFLKVEIEIYNFINKSIMKFLTKDEYIAPSVEVVDVACEAGFLGSTGELTYEKGEDDGWSNLY